ncbi:MAG: methylated-DNA--[protein]-cysteine S-methyltransferase [Sumerlaeia bacterium]
MLDSQIVRWNVYASPFGEGAFACTESGVCSLVLPQHEWGKMGFPPFRFAPHLLNLPILFDSSLGGREQLEAFFSPSSTSTNKCPSDLLEVDWIAIEANRSSFQRSVLRACATLPKGKAESYGELAVRSGYPGRARAVGTVMATNPVPLLIPCHRVLKSGGAVGSYGGGSEMKLAILQAEGALA